MLEKVVPIITCPVCGQEYLPSEIYMPKSFFGKPGEIIKTEAGKIDFYLGSDMDLTEEYVCDCCGSKLKIKTNLTFNIGVCDKVTDEEYVTKFSKPEKIKLQEEELF